MKRFKQFLLMAVIAFLIFLVMVALTIGSTMGQQLPNCEEVYLPQVVKDYDSDATATIPPPPGSTATSPPPTATWVPGATATVPPPPLQCVTKIPTS